MTRGAREVYLREFEKGTGAREIYSNVDQTNKMKTKKKGLQFKNFHKLWLSSQNSCDFYEFLIEEQKKKKGLRPKSFMKSGVSPPKLRKSGRKTAIWESQASICTPVAPSLLISSGHSPRLGGGAQFSFGEAQAVIWGDTASECPPWHRACDQFCFVLKNAGDVAKKF